MGCYDMIRTKCPVCGRTLTAQSKSGGCTLREYDFTEVPVSVASDANRHAPFECECGSKWIFGNIPTEEVYVCLSLLKFPESEDD